MSRRKPLTDQTRRKIERVNVSDWTTNMVSQLVRGLTEEARLLRVPRVGEFYFRGLQCYADYLANSVLVFVDDGHIIIREFEKDRALF